VRALETTVPLALPDAEAAVRRALAEQGFGVLTEIDVAAVLQAKLGVSRRPLKILGACNAGFAHRALELDPSLALLLPCNVVLEDVGEERTHVALADPRALLATDEADALALGEEAAGALQRVVHALGG
jgi:uncharacterized protein (DUF302 family)